MKTKIYIGPAAVLLTAALAIPTVAGATTDRVGNYDFSYQVTGDQRVRPVQVFDDGAYTYFQFRAGEAVPAIFVESTGAAVLLVPSVQGPYVRVQSVSGAFLLRMGHGVGRVAYVGNGRTGVAAGDGTDSKADAPAVEQPKLPRLLAASAGIQGLPREMFSDKRTVSLEVNSYATPIKGDRVKWTPPPGTPVETAVPFVAGVAKPGPRATRLIRSIAQAVSGANRIEITGRDDGTYKEGLAQARANAIADMLAAAGIPRVRLVIKASHGSTGASAKGVVTGASIATFAEKPRAEPTLATRGGKAAVEDIVARLRAGELSPSDAAKALASARSAAEPGKAVVEPAVVFERSPTAKWQVRASDGTVETMLRRWGQDSGWRVISKGAPEIRIKGDVEFERPDFLQAADYAITQAKQAGYPIEARAYSNKVLVIQTKD